MSSDNLFLLTLTRHVATAMYLRLSHLSLLLDKTISDPVPKMHTHIVGRALTQILVHINRSCMY